MPPEKKAKLNNSNEIKNPAATFCGRSGISSGNSDIRINLTGSSENDKIIENENFISPDQVFTPNGSSYDDNASSFEKKFGSNEMVLYVKKNDTDSPSLNFNFFNESGFQHCNNIKQFPSNNKEKILINEFNVKENPGEGDCFIYSLIDCLKYTSDFENYKNDNVLTLRKKIVNYMRSNSDNFFLTNLTFKNDILQFFYEIEINKNTYEFFKDSLNDIVELTGVQDKKK